MASAAILDIDSLVAPVPGDEPAGNAVPFGTRKKLDESRKEINPSSFAADDPMRPAQPKLADWSGIVKLGRQTLAETSKDLLVAARMTEALVKEHGYAGLRDGLKLLLRLVEDCWDRVLPAIEDGDVEVRAAAFNWLDDADRGARFPHTIRAVPLIVGEGSSFSWQSWRDIMDGKGKVQPQVLDQAIGAMPRDQCQTVVEDLTEGLADLEQLSERLNQHMGELAPGLSEVRRAMTECLALAQQVLDRKGPAVVAEPESSTNGSTQDTDPGAASAAQAAPVRRMNTREEVYAQLADVSARLLQLDPHSPITYLVQRAVRLSRLTLPQLMRVLIRDANSLGELNRDLDLGLDENGEQIQQ